MTRDSVTTQVASTGQDQVRDVTFERQPGGRVYETWPHGTEVDWGEVLRWERLTDEQLAKDCALAGGYLGGSYTKGWARILGCLATALGGSS